MLSKNRYIVYRKISKNYRFLQKKRVFWPPEPRFVKKSDFLTSKNTKKNETKMTKIEKNVGRDMIDFQKSQNGQNCQNRDFTFLTCFETRFLRFWENSFIRLEEFLTPEKKWTKSGLTFWNLAIFVRGSKQNLSNFGHFGHLGVPKMTTFWTTFWTLFWGFREIRKKALLLPIKFRSPRKVPKKVVRKCLKKGHFLKCQFWPKLSKIVKKTWFFVIFGDFCQKSEKNGKKWKKNEKNEKSVWTRTI